MWTHSGFFIEKCGEKKIVYASDVEELQVFADEKGYLRKDIDIEDLENFKEDGLYQAFTGYGPAGSFQDPTIYDVKKIGDVDWAIGKIDRRD